MERLKSTSVVDLNGSRLYLNGFRGFTLGTRFRFFEGAFFSRQEKNFCHSQDFLGWLKREDTQVQGRRVIALSSKRHSFFGRRQEDWGAETEK